MFKTKSRSEVKLVIVGNKKWWEGEIAEAYEQMKFKDEDLAASQIGAGIGFTYSRAMWKGKVRGNAGLAYDMCKAFGTRHLDGTMRHTVSLRIGCNF